MPVGVKRRTCGLALLVFLPAALHPQVEEPRQQDPLAGRGARATHSAVSNSTYGTRFWGLVEDLGNGDRSSGLFGLDAVSSLSGLVGETGLDFLTDVAYTPAGDIFALNLQSGESRLFQLDRRSGSPVAAWELPVASNALVSDKKGRLYLVSLDGALYRIDSAITHIRRIGPLGNGLVPSGDLALVSTGRKLFGTVQWSSSTDALAKISKKNGTAEVVGSIGYRDVFGLSFGPDGKLYGLANGEGPMPAAIRINTKTGQGEWVSDTNFDTAGGMASRRVLSPVRGKLVFTPGTPRGQDVVCIGDPGNKWTFCQHKTDEHNPGEGEREADDTYAWDINKADKSDYGKPVFPVAPGVIVQYGGTKPLGGPNGSVLVEHHSASGVWWSGYVHMENISVLAGQEVTRKTKLGTIGAAGLPLDKAHLHLIVYEGSNTQAGLVSVDATFFKR